MGATPTAEARVDLLQAAARFSSFFFLHKLMHRKRSPPPLPFCDQQWTALALRARTGPGSWHRSTTMRMPVEATMGWGRLGMTGSIQPSELRVSMGSKRVLVPSRVIPSYPFTRLVPNRRDNGQVQTALSLI